MQRSRRLRRCKLVFVIKLLAFLGVLSMLVGCGTIQAGGAPEPDFTGETAYLVYPSKVEGDARLARDRMDLPAAASAFAWAPFDSSTGRLIIEGARSFRKSRLIETVQTQNCVIYGYSLEPRVDAPREGAEEITLQFTCTALARGPFQPHRWAQITGIERSGRVRGAVRLKNLEHLGSGRFRAVLLIAH